MKKGQAMRRDAPGRWKRTLTLTRRRAIGAIAALSGLGLFGSRRMAFGRELAPEWRGFPPAGTILLADNFSDPSNGQLPQSSDRPDKTAIGYVSGEYRLAVVDPDYPLGAIAGVPGTYSDATINLDARMLPQSKPQAAFYLRARGTMTPDGYSGYSLGIYPLQGAFSLGRVDPGSDSSTASITNLLGGPALQTSAAIKRGTAVNHVQFTCQDEAIRVSINDQLVASIRDDKLQAGRISLAAAFGTGGRLNISGPIDVRLSNLVISTPV
jgi:hypothetical protein